MLYRLLPLVLLPAVLHATDFPVSGQIVDAATGRPLADANITAGDKGSRSDQNGRFTLRLAPGDSLRISFVGYETLTVQPPAAIDALVIRLRRAVLAAPELVVHGGLRTRPLAETAASVTVLDRQALRRSGGHHFQDLARAVPNLNWAGGTSRPRYFQVRGMGERSHYAGEGPPNFSVGFVIDDVDMSGLGGAGLLFDLDQLEVFKGPQSTTYGPNAMAGLINLRSTDPAVVASRKIALAMGSDALSHFSAAATQPLSDRLSLRLGYHRARADGFRENHFRHIQNSNARREDFARAKLRYDDDNGLVLLLTAFRSDQNNGYDAWTPDNNEDFITYSDQPGKDHQTTRALSLRAEKTFAATQIVAITALSDTELEYSYDSDWGNDQYWLQEPYNFDSEVEGWRYAFFDRTLRDRDTFTQELRVLRGDAVAGVYFKTSNENDEAWGWLFGGDAAVLQSDFQVDNLAFFGEYAHALDQSTRISLNLRLDRNDIDYIGSTDSAGGVNFDVSQWLAGGKLALTRELGAGRTLFAAASRGYRAGGVNQHPRLDAQNRPYDPEYLLNFEVGYRTISARSTTSLTVFHAMRWDQQVSLSSQQDPGDPNSFFYFTANAAGGRVSGIEVERSYLIAPSLRISTAMGLLRTHVDAYTSSPADSLGNRAAAHAPHNTRRYAVDYAGKGGLFAGLEYTSTDRFYHSDSHDQQADAHRLVHGRLGYRHGPYTVALWGRNLLDERYAVRGFFFGLAPPDYVDTLYESYGDPRQLGLNLSAAF